jgi:hypothetical protein
MTWKTGSKRIGPKNMSCPENKLSLLRLEHKRKQMTPLSSELTSSINMKFIALSLSFPMHIHVPQSDTRNSNYDMWN